jgi:polyhydroxybutyrate depolymerase
MRAHAIAAALALAATSLLGCRPKPTCGPADSGCDGEGRILQGTNVRTFRYHLPKNRADSRPLLIALHGGGGDGKGMMKIAGLGALSDAEGVVVVYPDGISRSWNDGRGATDAAHEGADDVAFLSALIDSFVSTYSVDPRRVYVTGLSNGAMMSFRLACDLSGKITAIAAIAGLMPEPLLARCAPSRPVPVLLFAGKDDPLVPYGGGPITGDRGRVASAAATIARWAELDKCAGAPLLADEPDTDPRDHTRVKREERPGCAGSARVVLYTVEGGGHTWPGGRQYLPEPVIGRTSRDIDANTIMWAFFKASSM